MRDDSLSHLLLVAAQAVRLKQVVAVREMRRAVAREVHVKQAGSAEKSLGKVIEGQIERQVEDIAKAVGSGAKPGSEANLEKWKDGLVDAALPVLAIRMAEAAVAQMVMVGVDPRSKGARRLMRKHLPGRHDQSDHGHGGGGSEITGPGTYTMYRGVGEGADVDSGFEWFSQTSDLASRYADFRGGKVLKAEVTINSPVNVGNSNQILNARSFSAQAMKQVDLKSVDKTEVMAARKKFLEDFGDDDRSVLDYWSNPEAKESTRGFLESLGFDSITMMEGDSQTVAVFRASQIKYSDENKSAKHLPGQHNQLDHGRGLQAAVRVGDEWRMEDGSPLPDHLPKAIPPKWKAVMVNPDPEADLLVKGTDEKGRGQAIYSEAHWAEAAKAKFGRINELRSKEREIAEEILADMSAKDPATRDSASCLRLIQVTGLRPGGEGKTMAEKKAYGATTLEGRHVVAEGRSVRLRFVGKKGVDLDIEVNDPKVRKDLIARKKKAGDDGKLYNNTGAAKLSAYSHERDGGGFKTKDFRTAKGTSTAVEAIKGMKAPKTQAEYKKAVREVGKAVSKKLGNTVTVALQSYIDPAVFSQWRLK